MREIQIRNHINLDYYHILSRIYNTSPNPAISFWLICIVIIVTIPPINKPNFNADKIFVCDKWLLFILQCRFIKSLLLFQIKKKIIGHQRNISSHTICFGRIAGVHNFGKIHRESIRNVSVTVHLSLRNGCGQSNQSISGNYL